jgi:uroporphyrinogen decarboxylase
MTSRERVLAALAHQKPDRTPRDFWAEPAALNRLMAHMSCNDEETVLQKLEIDLRHIKANGPADVEISPGVFQNFWGERFVYKSTAWGKMREDMVGALGAATKMDDLRSFPWPTCDSFDYSSLKEQCRLLDKYALMYGFADVWQRPGLVRGLENMFVDMVEQSAWTHFLGRKFTDFYLEDYTRAFRSSGGRIDLFLLISDLGGQSGTIISPSMFREFVAPYMKEMIDRIHELGARVMFHSCGTVRAFIPEFIKLGVDVLDPIQPTGPEMTPESLQAEFGGKISFHGGLDMQNLLPYGTPEKVRAEARRYSRVLGSNGGYIVTGAHLYQPDVPPENILAVYESE